MSFLKGTALFALTLTAACRSDSVSADKTTDQPIQGVPSHDEVDRDDDAQMTACLEQAHAVETDCLTQHAEVYAGACDSPTATLPNGLPANGYEECMEAARYGAEKIMRRRSTNGHAPPVGSEIEITPNSRPKRTTEMGGSKIAGADGYGTKCEQTKADYVAKHCSRGP